MVKKQNGRNVGKKQFTAAERKSFFAGLFAGLNKSKKNVSKMTKYPATVPSKTVKKKSPERKKWYTFLAFNDNGDVFNVEAYDSSRANALKQARSKLKRDPEMPCWGVSITEDAGSQEYYRILTVDENYKSGVSDNFKMRYRDADDYIREKYGKDLSKPLKR